MMVSLIYKRVFGTNIQKKKTSSYSEAKPTQGGQNGNRERIGKSYLTHFYNLDAILSDGYSANRANSVNTTAFRRWSTRICQT